MVDWNEKRPVLRAMIGRPTTDWAQQCWGFVLYASLELFGRKLPALPCVMYDRVGVLRATHALIEYNFVEAIKPADGHVVGMGNGRAIRHVGLYCEIDGGVVVHAQETAGVVLHTVRDLPWRNKRFFRSLESAE